MAYKGETLSDDVKARMSAGQKARWEVIRSKMASGEQHETRCTGTATFFQHFRTFFGKNDKKGKSQ